MQTFAILVRNSHTHSTSPTPVTTTQTRVRPHSKGACQDTFLFRYTKTHHCLHVFDANFSSLTGKQRLNQDLCEQWEVAHYRIFNFRIEKSPNA